MDLDTALHTALVDDDIKKHCHVNSNEDGDRFVGIKADSDNAMVYFPIGYQLPETDNEIRTDIKHLIQVLSEFTTSEDRLIAVNKFAAPQSVDFPINAYKNVIYQMVRLLTSRLHTVNTSKNIKVLMRIPYLTHSSCHTIWQRTISSLHQLLAILERQLVTGDTTRNTMNESKELLWIQGI